MVDERARRPLSTLDEISKLAKKVAQNLLAARIARRPQRTASFPGSQGGRSCLDLFKFLSNLSLLVNNFVRFCSILSTCLARLD